jgi:hypothetical protein
MELYVFPSIALCATTMVDLWMSKFSFDTFALVINFINEEHVPCHVIVGMFEALNTSKATLVKQVKSLLVEYQPTMKFIVYIKDEGANLNTIVIALTYVFFVHHCKLQHHLLTFSLGILCLRHVNMPQMRLKW